MRMSSSESAHYARGSSGGPPNKPMQLTARVLKRKVIGIMSCAEFSHGQHRFARWPVTPQLMGRAVRWRPLT